MNILHKLRQALINAGWIRGVEVEKPRHHPAESVSHAIEVRLLDSRLELVREMMVKAKAQKKRWKHHEAKWKQLCEKRAELTGTK